MGQRVPPPPVWFLLTLVLIEGLAWRALGSGDELAPDERRAFWGFVVIAAQAIWTGVQVVAQATLTVLAWSVKALWAFATTIYNALKVTGRALLDAGKWTLDFLEKTYDRVLKPAWQHFWKWFDRAKKWLQDVLRPVFAILNRIKGEILEFYNSYVRPILDAIGIARRVLRVFESFGWDWAGALDRRLADLEERIDKPFRLVLAKVNEVIGIVNRIVTLDGLLQRVTLLRSIERDVRAVSAAVANWRDVDMTPDDWKRIKGRASERTEQQIVGDFIAAVGTGAERHRAVIAELAAQWETRIERGY